MFFSCLLVLCDFKLLLLSLLGFALSLVSLCFVAVTRLLDERLWVPFECAESVQIKLIGEQILEELRVVEQNESLVDNEEAEYVLLDPLLLSLGLSFGELEQPP